MDYAFFWLGTTIMVDIATHYHGARHPNILASRLQYLCWLFKRIALSQHNHMYHSH